MSQRGGLKHDTNESNKSRSHQSWLSSPLICHPTSTQGANHTSCLQCRDYVGFKVGLVNLAQMVGSEFLLKRFELENATNDTDIYTKERAGKTSLS
jgi:hypothetical protein